MKCDKDTGRVKIANFDKACCVDCADNLVGDGECCEMDSEPFNIDAAKLEPAANEATDNDFATSPAVNGAKCPPDMSDNHARRRRGPPDVV